MLVRGVVLLVDDDEAEVGERREDGGARADDDARLAAHDPSPLVPALARTEAAVQHRDAASEAALHAVEELVRERDLGDEEQHRPAARPRLRRRLQVDFRLAASGDAVEEKHLKAAAAGDRLDGDLLIACERQRRSVPADVRCRVAVTLVACGMDDAAADERRRRGALPRVERPRLQGPIDGADETVVHGALARRSPREERERVGFELRREHERGLEPCRRCRPAHLLLDRDDVARGEGAQRARYAPVVERARQLLDRARPRPPQMRDDRGLERAGGRLVEVLTETHDPRAACAQTARQRRREDVGERAAIVIRRPATEREQIRRDDRLVVEDADDRTNIRDVGRGVRELDDDPGFATPSDGNHDAHTAANAVTVGLGHAVRQQVLAGDRRNERHRGERACACVTREGL